MAANKQDIQLAQHRHLDAPMIIRLYLDATGVKKMAEGLRQIVELPDPIREIQNLYYRQTAIQGGKCVFL